MSGRRSLPALVRTGMGPVVVGLTVATLAIGALVVSGSAAAAPTRVVIHVDCGARSGGGGSVGRPLDTLAAASAAPLAPGQRLLFRRGSVCAGSLVIHQSGTASQPVVVGAYGIGPSPRIVGTGTDAVLLDNASNVVLENLDISNPGTTPATRRGVHVVADGTTVAGVTLENLSIHEVDGDLRKDSQGSAGIQVDALGTAPLGRFDGLSVVDNQVENVSRGGIVVVGTQGGNRPAASQPWPAGSSGVVVRGNILDHLAGDGIVAEGTVGALLEDNSVSDGNRAGTPFTAPNPICDAGIWAWDANSTVIQDNQVSHMEFNGCDGIAYDVDYNQDGTVVQDNFSYDNGGGFLLLCSDPEVRVATVRYNLSVDDAATFNEAPCAISSGVGSLNGITMDNNTLVTADPRVTLELTPLASLFDPGNFAFRNNIVVATTPQTIGIPCGNQCTHNLFFQLPAAGTDAVVGNPRFADPGTGGTTHRTDGTGYVVRPRSPARGAGIPIPDGAATDYFGHPVPTVGSPTIGFFQPS